MSPLAVAAVAEVVAAAVAVAAGATIVPAVRGARASTISALNDPAHPPRRRAWLIALSARLPVPLLFAVRLIARRPRRAVLTAASLTIAVAMIVATLALRYRIDVHNREVGSFVGSGGIADEVSHLVYLLSAILVVLAAINAIFTTWSTVIDAQRPTALTRALGATPWQISAGLTAAQLIRRARALPGRRRSPPGGEPAALVAARRDPRHADRGRAADRDTRAHRSRALAGRGPALGLVPSLA